jgi:hypothetical protein
MATRLDFSSFLADDSLLSRLLNQEKEEKTLQRGEASVRDRRGVTGGGEEESKDEGKTTRSGKAMVQRCVTDDDEEAGGG